MRSEVLLSAGIDIGTTTTHLIISKIGIAVEGGFGTVPKAVITDKQIVYKSPVYLTPLNSDGNIDGAGVAGIIAEEYHRAGVTREDLNSGAVIITGESSKKANASEVLHEIADLSGDFIAAQAGAELESYLAGKGAGADTISADTLKITANVDVGGGTTNISVFDNGELVDDCCLNIGGRLVKFQSGEPVVSDTIRPLYDTCGSVKELCFAMAQTVKDQLLGKGAPEHLVTDHQLTGTFVPEVVNFSGGVAQCMAGASVSEEFQDIGVLLASALTQVFADYPGEVRISDNPIRATVIGAGNFSLDVSGSTINYSHSLTFPLKNLQCVTDLSKVGEEPCAICPSCEGVPSFQFVEGLAADIVNASEGLVRAGHPLVVVVKEDYSKALGICLGRKLPRNYPYICVDSIDCKRGDYIDIGEPIAGGKVVPVVVKTLVFGG